MMTTNEALRPALVECRVKVRRWAPPGQPATPRLREVVELFPGEHLVVGARSVALPDEYAGLWPADDGGALHRVEISLNETGLDSPEWGVRAHDEVPGLLVDVENGLRLTAGVGVHRPFVPDGHPWRLRVDGRDVDDVGLRIMDRSTRHDLDLVFRRADGVEHVFCTVDLEPRQADRHPRWAGVERQRTTLEVPARWRARRSLWLRYFGDDSTALPVPNFIPRPDSWLAAMVVTADLVAEGCHADDLGASVLDRLPQLSARDLPARWKTGLDRNKFHPRTAYGLPEPLSKEDPLVELCTRPVAKRLWSVFGQLPTAADVVAVCQALNGPGPDADFFPGLEDVADKDAFLAWCARRRRAWRQR
jgi:hypothetical protein